MSTTARALLLMLAALVAIGGLARTVSRTHEAELKRATNIARTTRFGARNDTRIDVWFRETRPGHRLVWQPAKRGLFEAEVPLILQVIGPESQDDYPFSVDIDARALKPAADPSRVLIGSVRAWAAQR